MTALVPYGLSSRQVAARLGWLTRRERYGQGGMTREARARQVAAMRALRQRTCQRGHRIEERDGVRRCWSCWRISTSRANGLAAVRRTVAARLVAARQRAVRVHPDRGGTDAAFRRAWTTVERLRAHLGRTA